MDFWKISSGSTKKGVVEVYPKFIVGKSKDLMIRGGDFYAFWKEDEKRWSTDEDELIQVIDRELSIYVKENANRFGEDLVIVKYMWDSDSGIINKWHTYCQKQMRDNYVPLDTKLIFANDVCVKEDYSSKRLSYALEQGPYDNWDTLISVLYSPEERHKVEWCIGAIVTGASKKLQKFLVLYGDPGSGKGTILKIIQDKLFAGYSGEFDAEALGKANGDFALEPLKKNPIVSICQDGDLSKIEQNTRLNSLISHEKMVVNEKHKSLYSMEFITFTMIGTNSPVRITNAKSGLNRRLIDAMPTGNKLPVAQYEKILAGIDFELGAIAYHCKEVYLSNPRYYDDYRPINMASETNDFFNYVEDCYSIFKKEDGVTLKQAWELYSMYNEDAKVLYPLPKRAFKAELKNYFKSFEERIRVGEDWVRSYYSGFKTEMFEISIPTKTVVLEQKLESWLDLKNQQSKLDECLKDMYAQYANDEDHPRMSWDKVKTVLGKLDTSKVHYVLCPLNLICIDFDIKDENGNKSYELNKKAASKFPKTYAEVSKGGGGIHLHYWYDGDVSKLSSIYSDGIEVKVYTGKSALRRRLSLCNNADISHISSGLPLKEVKMSTNWEGIKDEAHLINIIKQNLNKEYGSTTVSINYIYNALENAFANGIVYDVTKYYQNILNFANRSTHNKSQCISVVCKMKLKSEANDISYDDSSEKTIVFYDVEVFPNLFLINWKKLGVQGVHRMINPTPKEVSILQNYRLVGFNCRKYDNHMIWARMLGYSNEELYNLSQDIIKNGRGFFGKAYNLSFTDIYDYASKKQSLKKWEIELGIHHMELGLPWDQPVPEEQWEKVAEYCDNDVISTEAVWEATQGDFTARAILAELAGMSVNDTTNSLTTKIIFGDVKNPQLVYTDLSELFPGYEYVKNVEDINGVQKITYANMYRGNDLGFGGWVFTQPGMYGNVALLDVASLHPTSIEELEYLGEFTKNFSDIKQTRIFIKHKEYDNARKLFGGKLSKYLDDPSTAKQLSQALKIAINSVYGLTSAKFDNPFRDKRNVNNIVALRGALFMRTLQDEVTERGFKVIHIKTDSIKIADATVDIINFCMEFAKKYGYTFEHEATYDRICLVNKAVYIAKYSTVEQCEALYGKDYVHKNNETCAHNKEEGGTWTATGTQFQIPYVFKKCFSKEDICFKDLCETKEVKTAMYLNMNENSPEQDNLIFIGRVGLFCPIIPGHGGGILLAERQKKEGVTGYDAVVGTKGYRWREAEDIRNTDYMQDIDLNYYKQLVDEAIDTIKTYGNYEWFVSDDPYQQPVFVNGHPDYEATKCLPF